ncbi:MAG: prepilin-type N-terminal cleavage/methylation domain-containing protein [Phycisphaeraceae bacterium]|nr:prepilin-type N-terminal cleavage/methylation domain-containing protein [Phycisphaeraceae bacterium]MCW5761700.1 prepilin-type N-terminal cleavage/methylation domain-containing protein [Phycisphaeraceae bacterium]
MSRVRTRRGFSIIELLIALVITSTLLTATLAALDASFKSYKVTSESASTHVVSRIVMQRLMAMIRNGDEFGPYPINPLTTPMIESDWMEFVSYSNAITGVRRVTTLSRQENDGSFDLIYTLSTFEGETLVEEQTRPLIRGLTQLNFIMEYDVGPRLKRVTVDMVVQPNDLQDAAVAADLDAPTIRMVASASPRRVD